MIRSLRTIILPVAILFLLAACGGGGGGDSSVAGGGIEGTGTGTISGFGSVIINDTRTFAVNASTEILLDDTPITEAELQTLGLGMVARVDVGTDVSDDFTSGTAVLIHAVNLVKGPVTSITPLQVLGQDVVTTGDTILANLNLISDLKVNDVVEVSGYADANNVIQATRIELKPLGIAEWKLTGLVSGPVTGTSFFIGIQQVNFAGVTPRDCGVGPVIGDLVKIKAAENPLPFSGTLENVTSVECVPPGLEIPDGAPPNLEAEVEGLVTSVTLPVFFVGGQQVLITGTTVFEAGGIEDIVLGAKLEAEGVLDTATGILTANRIRFRNARVRIEALVTADNGTSMVVLGLTVNVTPLTVIEPGVSVGVRIEVRGFADSTGQIFASRIRPKGVSSDVRLRGPVTDIPGLADFAILGVNVDTAVTPLFLDVNGQSITESQFFASIAIGSQVDVEGGTFDGAVTISSAPTTIIAIED